MDTISHNIANVNTPGYTRQRAELATRTPQWNGAQYFGSGVDIANVGRIYDQYLVQDVQTNTSAAADQRVQYNLAAQLDTLLGSSETSLSPVLQNFFNAIDDAAADPTSLSARELVLSQAEQLVQRFHALDTRFQQIQDGVQTQARSAVGEINDLAQAIADINRQIVSQSGALAQPNDLLDRRDQLVTQLAERVAVTTTIQDDGALNVFIGTGQALVMGSEARQLAVASGGTDASQTEILFVSRNGVSTDVTSQITGGSLGALMTFAHGMLADTRRRIDQLALGVADQINAQHQLGMDLNGNLGGLFFNDINSPELQAARAVGVSGNTGSAALAVTVDSVGQLQDSDYRVLYDGTNYSLIRLSDNKLVQSGSLGGLTTGTGFSISMSGAMAAGDSFTISTAIGAARQLAVEVPDGQSLALAGPVRSVSAIGNLGDAKIGAATATNLAGNPLAQGITLTYSQAAGRFAVSDAGGNSLGSLSYDPAADNGATLTLSVAGFGDIHFTMNGAPVDGDTFSISGNAGGVSDNRNALALSGLQQQRSLLGGSATFAEQYSRTVSGVAARTQALDVSATAHESLLASAQDARDSYSGVNLDEEAANLLRYQQAYQASAKVIGAASDLFQVLLNAVGG